MPRVKQVTARKDYPNFGIVKGQKHYRWVLKTGPRSSREYRQEKPPRRSQLTTSSFLSTIYDISDVSIAEVTDPDDVDGIIQEIEDAKNEVENSLDNMPESLKESDTGQMLQTRIDGCDEWSQAIESAKSTWESAIEELGEDPDEAALYEAKDAFIEEANSAEPDWG